MLLVATGCSGDDDVEQESAAAPDEVVARWLAAIAALDVDGLAATTHPPSVALVAGAENGFGIEQMEAVVQSGLPAATRRSYWTSFRDSFQTFLGGNAGDIVVTEVEEFDVGGTTFAAVHVRHEGDESEIITQLHPDGWVVDLVATAGPALAVQIRRLVAQLVAEGDEDAAHAYATMAVSSLGAALERDPTNRSLELELEAIEDLPIDLSR